MEANKITQNGAHGIHVVGVPNAGFPGTATTEIVNNRIARQQSGAGTRVERPTSDPAQAQVRPTIVHNTVCYNQDGLANTDAAGYTNTGMVVFNLIFY